MAAKATKKTENVEAPEPEVQRVGVIAGGVVLVTDEFGGLISCTDPVTGEVVPLPAGLHHVVN